MQKSKSIFDWNKNSFWGEIKQRLEKVWSNFSGNTMSVDSDSGKWMQRCSCKGASQVGLLQNKFTVVDITDRGFSVCPMVLNGRYYGRLSFEIDCGGTVIYTHPWEVYEQNQMNCKYHVLFEPDSISVTGIVDNDIEFDFKTIMPPSFPFLLFDVAVKSHSRVTLTPQLLWMPGEYGYHESDNILWLKPKHIPIMDPVLSNNNSKTADPPRLEDGKQSGIGIAYAEGIADLRGCQRQKVCLENSIILCDRLFSPAELEKLAMPPVEIALEDGEARFSILLGVCVNENEFINSLKLWNSISTAGQEREKRYWSGISYCLSLKCADIEIENQFSYSVKSSIFSRSLYDGDKTIFIHGRPDRGYGDCSKLHQSYQMHYVALASGQTGSVREELLAFAEFQDDRGDMAVQLRPGSGYHHYVGLYSNAHFIMALYRYLCWTGDFNFIGVMVENPVTKKCLSILERAKLAANWLLENRREGVVKPCGWLDAWPPKVIAQAQISIVTYMALIELSKILFFINNNKDGYYYKKEALYLAKNIKDIFFNDANGLFAEHLFGSGKVEGGQINDFWAHTQIWAALAGLSPDSRGLEICREYCLTNGMAVIPETCLETDYIKDSTDGVEKLSIGSTVTWLRATWPELTHLYALAEIKYGRISQALDAVIRQLPENIHLQNTNASPYYYSEKYIYPYNIPWLCTWSGDPTLIQVLLEGFGGLELSINGLKINPKIPKEWRNMGGYKISFFWRRRKVQLMANGYGDEIREIKVNNKEFIPYEEITPEMLDFNKTNNIIVSF
ncbi:MAG: hypothetical protein FJW63_04840 [Actinobacteria bacterium]|nr:hypothetical protein [Actinomycetota bacterium]